MTGQARAADLLCLPCPAHNQDHVTGVFVGAWEHITTTADCTVYALAGMATAVLANRLARH